MKIHKFWKKVEYYNSKLISFALLALIFLIIYELFFYMENPLIKLGVSILDSIIVTIFIIDLIFLAIHSKNVRFFFKNYWLDILAVFPFVFFFNIINSIYRAIIATEKIFISQAVFHEILETGKGAKILGEAGRFTKISARVIRAISKSRLFAKIIHHTNRHRRRHS